MKNKSVFLVGADTGGHVVPVFSLAKDLENDVNVIVLGVGSEIEKKFYSKLKKTKYIKLLAGKIKSGKLFQNIIALFSSFLGFFQSLGLILAYRPKVIFLKGNYATLPIAYAAKVLFVPVLIHESDAIMGRSNRQISSFAKSVFVSYPVEIYQNKSNLVYSGLILRDDLERLPIENKFFTLDPQRKTILILGGSLGAHSVNQVVFKTLKQLVEQYQIIHQTGQVDFNEAQSVKSELEKGQQKYYCPVPFLDDNYIEAVKRSDLVVSRSGSVVMELAALKKPSILIPYPYAAADHQAANAKYFADKGAAIVMEGRNISPTTFYSEIAKTISNPNRLKALSESIHKSIRLDGKDIVLKKILEFLK